MTQKTGRRSNSCRLEVKILIRLYLMNRATNENTTQINIVLVCVVYMKYAPNTDLLRDRN